MLYDIGDSMPALLGKAVALSSIASCPSGCWLYTLILASLLPRLLHSVFGPTQTPAEFSVIGRREREKKTNQRQFGSIHRAIKRLSDRAIDRLQSRTTFFPVANDGRWAQQCGRGTCAQFECPVGAWRLAVVSFAATDGTSSSPNDPERR